MNSIIIRKFKPDYLPKVVHINRICLPENYPPFFFMDLYKNFPETFLVAMKDDEIVGYVMCRIEYGISNLKKSFAKKGHIISLAVIPSMRRRGIGEQLMRKALENMRKIYNVNESFLEVRVSNIPAINLYKKLGFKTIRVIRKYYMDGEDAYLMAKAFT